MNREDFLMLKNDIVYFDNGATTFKPEILSQTINQYYNEYCANAHRGDYDISLKVDEMYESTRKKVKELLHAKETNEIIFTSGATDALNKVIFGYFKYHLVQGDEILLSKSEHASNVLPWFELADELGLVIRYIELDEHRKITIENVKQAISPRTRVISIAQITNVVGDIRPIEEINHYAHAKDILVVIDGAQSVPHIEVDVEKMDIDFLAFSAHKMYGPTGVGVLYGKKELLNQIRPIEFGGGMNSTFSSDGIRIYDELPHLLEPGTPNIAGVIGFGSVLDYLGKIGMNRIIEYEQELHKYAIDSLRKVPNVILYNEYSEGSIIAMNIQDIFAQDLAIYLNKYKICVRAGNHCAKILKDELGIKNTCRISLALYNTKEEIDYLVKVLSNPKLKEEII